MMWFRPGRPCPTLLAALRRNGRGGFQECASESVGTATGAAQLKTRAAHRMGARISRSLLVLRLTCQNQQRATAVKRSQRELHKQASEAEASMKRSQISIHELFRYFDEGTSDKGDEAGTCGAAPSPSVVAPSPSPECAAPGASRSHGPSSPAPARESRSRSLRA